jgi:flavin reductase ActVB
MTPDAEVGAAPFELFREAMAGLASGVSVVTARRPDGSPCGLAATSVSSFSAHPPSVLVSVAHASRCHEALAAGEWFGVHLLSAAQEDVARVFASLSDDKFADLDWDWEGEVPVLGSALAYLRCRRSAHFEHHDHSIVIGDVIDGRHESGEPLVYMRQRMSWRLGEVE